MSASLTYLQFHALYTLPVVTVLTATVHRRRERVDWRVGGVGLAVITLLAVVYTLPWDRALIQHGVWTYGPERVTGTVWGVPIEEVAFFVVQPALTALWTFHVAGPVTEGIRHSTRDRAVGLAAGLAVSLVGLACLTSESTLYLGAILAWAGPVLAIQWAAGWRYLLAVRERFALAVLVPTAYLWVVDWIAIDAGVWTISDRYTTGIGVAGLPVEEMTFFLVTNVFVVQGLVLFYWVVERWR
jgi:lycopene cyclase domain-containing protein